MQENVMEFGAHLDLRQNFVCDKPKNCCKNLCIQRFLQQFFQENGCENCCPYIKLLKKSFQLWKKAVVCMGDNDFFCGFSCSVRGP